MLTQPTQPLEVGAKLPVNIRRSPFLNVRDQLLFRRRKILLDSREFDRVSVQRIPEGLSHLLGGHVCFLAARVRNLRSRRGKDPKLASQVSLVSELHFL